MEQKKEAEETLNKLTHLLKEQKTALEATRIRQTAIPVELQALEKELSVSCFINVYIFRSILYFSDKKTHVKKEEEVKKALKEERMKLEESKSNLSTSLSKSAVLERLMEQKVFFFFKKRALCLYFTKKLQKVGNIQGIYGRLGSLGTIAVQFDVAITSACPSLNNIVVDTVQTAQKFTFYHYIKPLFFMDIPDAQNF
jgi:structural maintenance of chromosome 4